MAELQASSADGTPSAPRRGHALRHIPELDGIRGIAAVVVFGHHAITTSIRTIIQAGGWPSWIVHLSNLFEFANTGVDLFFVLSGFLITSILIGEQKSSRYYQDFYWKRALRILPLYLTMIAIVWIAFHQTVYMLMALAFVVNFAGQAHVQAGGEPGPFWTLAIEEQFYLLWPTVVRRLSLRQILRTSISIGIGCAALRFLFAVGNHHSYGMTPLRCDGLAFGAALACHFFVAGSNVRLRRRFDPLLWCLAAVGVLAIFSCFHWNLGRFTPPVFQAGVVLITGPVIGLCIANTGSSLLAILRSRILAFFGLISYSFYLIHIYVILLYDHFFGPLGRGDLKAYWTRLAVTFCASIAMALVSRYVLELPAMRLRKYVLKHPNLDAERAHPPLPLAPM